MSNTIRLGSIVIEVTRKDIRNVHLSVHPPSGRVSLVAPTATRLEVARAFAATKLGWIREQQTKFRAQAREMPRRFVERESHYLWGRRHQLSVIERDAKPMVKVDHRRITLVVRPGTSVSKRRSIMHSWHKALLHEAVPPLITKWETKLGVEVDAYFLQRMKTRWGSCNHHAARIRLNTELVKKPRDLLEYVVVHEMLHLIEPTHSERFRELLSRYYRGWIEARMELNELPVAAESWGR
jgi:predicted metal-dependent hydrolase